MTPAADESPVAPLVRGTGNCRLARAQEADWELVTQDTRMLRELFRACPSVTLMKVAASHHHLAQECSSAR